MLKGLTAQGHKENTNAGLSLNEVRGLLVMRGSSLERWSRERGYAGGMVHMSVTGRRRGPKAKRIVAELKSELGM